MPHARKPKRQRRDDDVEIESSKRVHNAVNESPPPLREKDNNNSENKDVQPIMKRKPIVFLQGERIQVQTKIEKLSKNMNRPSLFLKLGSSNFLDDFEQCWKEHIEGFVGLRGSKRERSEKEKQMEWRQRVKDLSKVKKNIQVKKSGQTVSEAERLLVVQRYRELMATKMKT